MDITRTYEKIAEPAVVAWLLAFVVVWAFLRFGRDVMETILMKLYEFFIQRSPVWL